MKRIAADDRHDIGDVKARYCRCLDEKDWTGYADTFTHDATLDTSGSGGAVLQGRDDLVAAVRHSLEAAITVHHVHHPEMTAVDADTVDVTWPMNDRVIWSEDRAAQIGKRSMTGYGYYRDRYIRCEDDRWRIAQSRLTRLHIDFEPMP